MAKRQKKKKKWPPQYKYLIVSRNGTYYTRNGWSSEAENAEKFLFLEATKFIKKRWKDGSQFTVIREACSV